MPDDRPASRRADTPLTINQLLNILTITKAAYGGEWPCSYGTYPIAGGVLVADGNGGWRISFAQTSMFDATGGF